ncbi:MAG: hypothetical protein ABI614_21815, partial [Planctomycetota bacterium]
QRVERDMYHCELPFMNLLAVSRIHAAAESKSNESYSIPLPVHCFGVKYFGVEYYCAAQSPFHDALAASCCGLDSA